MLDSPEMRGLSLLQPWATLAALRLKKLETRSWPTDFHGLLAIHASLGRSAQVQRLCTQDVFIQAALSAAGLSYDTLPTGQILAVAGLQGSLRMQQGPVPPGTPALDLLDAQQLPDQERAFGAYQVGRYAWPLLDTQALSTPVPCRGSLRLWQLPADVRRQLLAQLGRP